MNAHILSGFMLSVTASLFIIFSGGANGAAIQPLQLTCEYLDCPQQVDTPSIRLGWIAEPVNSQSRGLRQSAYQILVAESCELLEKDNATLWDSGKVVSSSVSQIRYAGKPLKSRLECWWKVRLWDQNGNASDWSTPSSWRMGLLTPDDWSQAEWIAMKKDTRIGQTARPFQTDTKDKPVAKESWASPLLRKEFNLAKPVKSAWFYICGLGYCELYINGQKAGDRVLEPAQTSYDVHAFYTAYDITKLLQTGGNAAGMMVGNGFWGQNIAFGGRLEYDKPCAVGKLFIEYADGSVQTICTDKRWKASDGPVVFDNVYAGETYDARREKNGWDEPGYDDKDWQAVEIIKQPTQQLRSQMIEPMRCVTIIPPINITQAGDGRWIIDLGQNIAGFMRLAVQEKAGTQIEFEYAENLMPDGKGLNGYSDGRFATGVIQLDSYICKGQGIETWQPRFTYHGFRYAAVSGLSQKPTPETIQGVLVHTDVKRTGDFACSDPLLNKMYTTSIWTIVDNIHSIPEDCPHREKCGWLGDAHATAQTDFYNFDMSRFFTKFIEDIHSVMGRGGVTYLGQKATDGIPCNIAPGKRLCQESRIDWGAALILVPAYQYLHTGDLELFERFYPDIKRFIEYAQRFEKDGVIENGYGDWCPPGWLGPNRGGTPMACNPFISSTAIFYRVLTLTEIIARRIDDVKYADWCKTKAAQIKADFNRHFLKPVEGAGDLTYGSQTANVMALWFGLPPEGKDKQVASGLVYDIEKLHDGHHSTGIHGARYLYSVLCDYGYEDLAYKVMTQSTFPSYAYFLSRGLTTWPERQLEMPEGQPFDNRSYNHPMQSGFAAFFHETVAGIRPDWQKPGYEYLTLKPHLYKKLSWAKASTKTPYGIITSRWKSSNGVFRWDVEIPVGARAQIFIPAEEVKQITESGKAITGRSEFLNIQSESSYTSFVIGSGRYQFESQ